MNNEQHTKDKKLQQIDLNLVDIAEASELKLEKPELNIAELIAEQAREEQLFAERCCGGGKCNPAQNS